MSPRAKFLHLIACACGSWALVAMAFTIVIGLIRELTP